MKKLLLLAAVLAVGTSVFAVPGSGGEYINAGPAKYKDNGYNPAIGITLFDFEQDTDKVRRFIKKGPNRSDEEDIDITVLVHHPVAILPEYAELEGVGVLGEKLWFGDITFKVVGSMPVDVEIELVNGSEGDLFGMMKRATLKRSAFLNFSYDQITNPGDKLMMTVDLGDPGDVVVESKNIELDLYFTLDDIGKHTGKIIARAEYE